MSEDRWVCKGCAEVVRLQDVREGVCPECRLQRVGDRRREFVDENGPFPYLPSWGNAR